MKFFILFILSFYLISCSCSGGKNRTDSEYVLDMMNQLSVKAQEGSDQGVAYMRQPPEGTRAQNRSYYPFPKNPTQADSLKNPLKPTAEIITEGRRYYKMYCIYCHGTQGDAGVGALVASKMVIKPLSLLTQKAKNYSDGRLYHIIYNGQGLMGAYRMQLATEEQVSFAQYMEGKDQYRGSDKIWALVHYIRVLQSHFTQ